MKIKIAHMRNFWKNQNYHHQKLEESGLQPLKHFKLLTSRAPFIYMIQFKLNKINRYQNTAHLPRVKTTRQGLNSFKHFAAKTWNDLPDHFMKKSSFPQFKNLINSWNGRSCHCSACSQFYFILFALTYCFYVLLVLQCMCFAI